MSMLRDICNTLWMVYILQAPVLPQASCTWLHRQSLRCICSNLPILADLDAVLQALKIWKGLKHPNIVQLLHFFTVVNSPEESGGLPANFVEVCICFCSMMGYPIQQACKALTGCLNWHRVACFHPPYS